MDKNPLYRGNLGVLRRYVNDRGVLVVITQLVVAVLAIGSIYIFFRSLWFTWWGFEEVLFVAGGLSIWGWGVYTLVRASRRTHREPRSLSGYIKFLCVMLLVVLFFVVFDYAAMNAQDSMGYAIGGILLGALSLLGWLVCIGRWVYSKNKEVGGARYKALAVLFVFGAVAIVVVILRGLGWWAP